MLSLTLLLALLAILLAAGMGRCESEIAYIPSSDYSGSWGRTPFGSVPSSTCFWGDPDDSPLMYTGTSTWESLDYADGYHYLRDCPYNTNPNVACGVPDTWYAGCFKCSLSEGSGSGVKDDPDVTIGVMYKVTGLQGVFNGDHFKLNLAAYTGTYLSGDTDTCYYCSDFYIGPSWPINEWQSTNTQSGSSPDSNKWYGDDTDDFTNMYLEVWGWVPAGHGYGTPGNLAIDDAYLYFW